MGLYQFSLAIRDASSLSFCSKLVFFDFPVQAADVGLDSFFLHVGDSGSRVDGGDFVNTLGAWGGSDGRFVLAALDDSYIIVGA